MEKLDPESQHDIRLICSYQPDEIGSAMSTNFVSINRHLSVKQAMRALIAEAEENDNISTLFVSDDDGSFYGAIALKGFDRRARGYRAGFAHQPPFPGRSGA